MLKKLLISALLLFLLLFGALQFPCLFIDKQFSYQSFNIHSNNTIELNEGVKGILDSVAHHLSKSAFYDEKQVLNVYFVKGSWYETLIGWFGMKNIASSKFNQHIYIGTPDFGNNTLRNSNHPNDWVNLTQIITHEGVHSQMYPDYSTLGFMQTPSWINEGYCEYISYAPIRKDPNYDLSKLLEKHDATTDFWVKTEYEAMTPKLYLRDRILMEYLIDHKQLGIKEIIEADTMNVEGVLEEIRGYYK